MRGISIDSWIAEELGEVAPNRRCLGRVRSPKVDEQHANPAVLYGG